MILSELSLPYESEYVEFSSMKQAPFLAVNPNGRVPAITDPNTGITLWESGAIVEYLIATYDKDLKLSYALGSADDWHCRQWLAFQISGQGPYYGQAVYFTRFEANPKARERFLKEIERTVGVLNSWLAREEGQGWLVGEKFTYADVSFVPWAALVEMIFALKEEDKPRWEKIQADHPAYVRWFDAMMAREKVKEVWDERARVYGSK